MNVLITGSRGYVGNRLCQIINKSYKNKIEIIGLDSNLYQFKKKLEKKIIIKDVRDIQLSDLKNIDSIVHLASLSNDPLGSLNESLTKDINHKATTKLAKFAKKMSVKRFIFVSTQSVYGISNYKKKTIKENDKNIRPITLIFLTVIFTILSIFDGNLGEFTIGVAYIPVYQTLLMTVYAAYFAGRSIEKVKKVTK